MPNHSQLNLLNQASSKTKVQIVSGALAAKDQILKTTRLFIVLLHLISLSKQHWVRMIKKKVTPTSTQPLQRRN
jgi:hypothetical protein